MKIVRDRGDARWLPSRFNFALFRLFAYLRLRAARPEPRPGLILSIDRHQSAFENYAVCVLIVAVASVYLATVVNPILAILAIMFAFQGGIVLSGLVMRAFARSEAVTLRGASTILMACVIAPSIYFAPHASPAAYVARAFLLLLVLNAIASAIMFLLRGRVAALEDRFR